jgi:hypothetical protein
MLAMRNRTLAARLLISNGRILESLDLLLACHAFRGSEEAVNPAGENSSKPGASRLPHH